VKCRLLLLLVACGSPDPEPEPAADAEGSGGEAPVAVVEEPAPPAPPTFWTNAEVTTPDEGFTLGLRVAVVEELPSHLRVPADPQNVGYPPALVLGEHVRGGGELLSARIEEREVVVDRAMLEDELRVWHFNDGALREIHVLRPCPRGCEPARYRGLVLFLRRGAPSVVTGSTIAIEP